MNKITTTFLLLGILSSPLFAQDTKGRKDGLKRIGGGENSDDISVIVNGSVIRALSGLENLSELTSLSALSSLSELSKLSELAELAELDHLSDLDLDLDLDLDFDHDLDFDFDFDHHFDGETIIIDIKDLDINVGDIIREVMDSAKDELKRSKRQ